MSRLPQRNVDSRLVKNRPYRNRNEERVAACFIERTAPGRIHSWVTWCETASLLYSNPES